MSKVCLNLGSGMRNKREYVNIDAVKHTDATVVGDILHLSYADNSVDKIFSEHVIEHLDRADTDQFFSECQRMLRSGGELEMFLPCLRTWIQRYVRGEIDITTLDLFLYGPQLHPYDFHRHGMFNEKLTAYCNKYGFKIIELKPSDRTHSHWEIYLKATKN